MPWLSVNQTWLGAVSAVPMPLFALEVQRAAMPGAPGATVSATEGELRQNPRHDRVGPCIDRHRNGIFVGARLLERLELAVQEGGRHEVPVARGDAPRDERFVALQVDEAHIAPLADQHVAVAAPQRRAG